MLPESYNLREARESDLPAIVAIYNSIIASRMVTADLEPVTVEGRKPWFDAHNGQSRPIWVLTEKTTGHVTAWMSLDTFNPRAAYNGTVMLAIYIEVALRGRGLGGLLIEEAEKRAPACGVHTLLGYIFGHNQPSLRLFERAGYARWALLPQVAVLDGQERDLVIMGKRLGLGPNAAGKTEPDKQECKAACQLGQER